MTDGMQEFNDRKYKDMANWHAEIYIENRTNTAKVNWAGIGLTNVAGTEHFIKELQEAVEICKRWNEKADKVKKVD